MEHDAPDASLPDRKAHEAAAERPADAAFPGAFHPANINDPAAATAPASNGSDLPDVERLHPL